MSSPILAAGGQLGKQTRYAPLYTGQFRIGYYTQRSPLRDGVTTYIYDRWGLSRFDAIIDGSNVELSNKLTIQRRPGLGIYNNANFQPLDSFYAFRRNVAGVESIQVIADASGPVTHSYIYNATGPSGSSIILTKAGTSQAYFQDVGNVLYISDADGDLKQWDGTTMSDWGIATPGAAPTIVPSILITDTSRFWSPGATLPVNYSVLDTNGNIEVITTSGATGSTYPAWLSAGNSTTVDGAASWLNLGVVSAWAAGTVYPINSGGFYSNVVLDPNGYLQWASTGGTSGATIPSFSSTPGTTTTDNSVTWTNIGLGTVLAFTGWQYGYSWHTTSNQVSTSSPISRSTGPVIGSSPPSIQVDATYSTQANCDFVWLWRTLDKGSKLFFDTKNANNIAGGTDTFTDTALDSELNQLITAPIAGANNGPPAGLVALTYHLNRIWGAVGNVVYYSAGPDDTTGNGNESFPSLNTFTFPSSVTRLYPCTLSSGAALLVFTISDVYVILGSTAQSLFSVPYAPGFGLLNYNAFAVNGGVAYLFTSDKQLISFDPSTGISEVGFPIGDTLQSLDPTKVSLAWHVSGSTDKALYVCDGSTGWYRMNQTVAPEVGLNWSPKATITGGCGIVQSVETSPGVHQLLVGGTGIGNIFARNTTLFQDSGTSYPAYATVGNVVLAKPGQIAEIESITTDCSNVGTNVLVGVLFDEISGSISDMSTQVNDPPELTASTTIIGKRSYIAQLGTPAFCRHMQIRFTWPTENAKNEIYAYSIFGAVHQEK